MIDYNQKTYQFNISYGSTGTEIIKVTVPKPWIYDLGINPQKDRLKWEKTENGIILRKA